MTCKDGNKISGARIYHEFKPKSILRNQFKQIHLCRNFIPMSNNPPQLHNAGNPFHLQNNFQKLLGHQNGFQTQTNAYSQNGIHTILQC